MRRPQHVIILVKMIAAYVIPDMPQSVQNKIKREKFLAQQALHEVTLKGVRKDKEEEIALLAAATAAELQEMV